MLQLLSQHPLPIYIQKDCVLIEAVPESSLVAFLYPHVVQWEWEIPDFQPLPLCLLLTRGGLTFLSQLRVRDIIPGIWLFLLYGAKVPILLSLRM